MLTFTPDDRCATFAIDFDRFDCENPARGSGRWLYRYTITVDGEVVVDAADIFSGSTTVDRPEPLSKMLAVLLGFFASFIEALEHERRTGTKTENFDLFPAACVPLAEALDSGQVAIWANEIDGED